MRRLRLIILIDAYSFELIEDCHSKNRTYWKLVTCSRKQNGGMISCNSPLHGNLKFPCRPGNAEQLTLLGRAP